MASPTFLPLFVFFFACPILSFEIPIENKLASNGTRRDFFGLSVSLSGPLALVGAYGDDIEGNSDQGSAYLFNCSSVPCTLVDRLIATDGGDGDRFGFSVFLWGSFALIGAPLDDIGENAVQGSAYLFNCTSLPCSQADKLIASDGATVGRFGQSVSLDGYLALVGANEDNNSKGSAYIFNCTSLPCSQADKLIASDGAAVDRFGRSVSLSGSWALVGADEDDIETNANQGSAYLFDCSSFPCSQADKLVASDGAASDFFGFSVSLSGPLALVGAYGDDVNGNPVQGSAYLFNCTSLPCSEVEKLIESDGSSGDLFGFSVSLSGPLALVGVFQDNIEGNRLQGSAYLFNCASLPCSQVEKFIASDGALGDFLGYSVSISGMLGLVGAPFDDFGENNDQGSAYFIGFFFPNQLF